MRGESEEGSSIREAWEHGEWWRGSGLGVCRIIIDEYISIEEPAAVDQGGVRAAGGLDQPPRLHLHDQPQKLRNFPQRQVHSLPVPRQAPAARPPPAQQLQPHPAQPAPHLPASTFPPPGPPKTLIKCNRPQGRHPPRPRLHARYPQAPRDQLHQVPESQGGAVLGPVQGGGVPAGAAAGPREVRRRVPGDVRVHRRSGFIAALKVIRKAELLCGSAEENAKAVAQLAREVKVQAFLDHPNLIRLYDFFADEEHFYLLLEVACDGPLFELLESVGSFSQETTSIVVREVVAGVEYMHRHEVIHRDLKLENVVVSHGMAKICDFGWSVHCPREFRTTLCGTPLYLSPEILTGKQYNKKIDTWAIGALTHELFTGQNPFNIRNKDDLSKIVTEDFEMDTGSPELRSFVTFILRKNPSKRPDADTISRHPFIEKYRDLETSQELCQLVQRRLRAKAKPKA